MDWANQKLEPGKELRCGFAYGLSKVPRKRGVEINVPTPGN